MKIYKGLSHDNLTEFGRTCMSALDYRTVWRNKIDKLPTNALFDLDVSDSGTVSVSPHGVAIRCYAIFFRITTGYNHKLASLSFDERSGSQREDVKTSHMRLF